MRDSVSLRAGVLTGLRRAVGVLRMGAGLRRTVVAGLGRMLTGLRCAVVAGLRRMLAGLRCALVSGC